MKTILTKEEFKERFIVEIMKKTELNREIAKSVCDAHDEIDELDFDFAESPEEYAWEAELSYWSDDG